MTLGWGDVVRFEAVYGEEGRKWLWIQVDVSNGQVGGREEVEEEEGERRKKQQHSIITSLTS